MQIKFIFHLIFVDFSFISIELMLIFDIFLSNLLIIISNVIRICAEVVIE